ncbi:MAG: hypothetical protein HKM07_05305, partial [Chlamydiae bacterium]|nr:hypothetical protein [Chlamydiota bacterium]
KLAEAGLTNHPPSITPTPTPIGPFFPPPNPPPPPFKTGLLPIVLVNNSGLPDNQVYVLVTGVSLDSQFQVWGNIDTSSGVATLQDVALTDNSTSFSYLLSDLPATSGGHVIYIPQIRSGLIWFSMSNKLSMTVVNVSPEIPALQIVQPNFTSPADVNYATNFDIFEFAYLLAGAPQVATDATAVSFFSLPLYGYLAGATSASSNTGLYQPRSYIMSQAAALFATAPTASQWNKLLLTSGGVTLRLLSTGKAIAANLFDANYLDNAASYGYSYISDIWTGASSFYKQPNVCNMSVTVTVPSTATYTYQGSVHLDNTFVFTSSDGGPTVTFPAPVTSPIPTGTTTFNIFSAINFITPLPTAGTAADAVSKLFQEAIIAGLVPTRNTLSLSYLSSNQGSFYTVNSNLSPAGQTSGPWYDLYSKALHRLGSIYTYGFDEPLWPQVLLGGPFTDNVTYMGITIGSVQ